MKWTRLLLVLICLLTLCGCAGNDRGREPENTVLAQVVGVDRMDGVWLLTAAGKDGSGESVCRTVAGKNLAEVFEALPGSGETWISLSGVSDVLVGDGVELREVLLFILEDGRMSWRANVWCVPIAAAVMEEHTSGGGDRLAVLKEAGTATATVLETLERLEDEGEAKLPALTEREGVLAVGGTLYYGRKAGDG